MGVHFAFYSVILGKQFHRALKIIDESTPFASLFCFSKST